MFEDEAQKNGIGLNLEMATDSELSIVADQKKLKQIICNLVSNAVKFTPSGGSVTVLAQLTDKNTVTISVTDTGRGIKKEDISKLFQPFTQLSTPYSANGDGTGLGLALTKQLVELHGGSISVKSDSAIGSRFSVTIPLHPTKLNEPLDTKDKYSVASDSREQLRQDGHLM